MVDDAIKLSRTPIEEQLTEHTKLQRWDDYNYYSLKQSVHKAHSALSKFARQYQVTNWSITSTHMSAGGSQATFPYNHLQREQ